jgi:hypothetical protein
VLLLSYALNLGFWERFGLGAARGLGARVTTVADAHMRVSSPRRAGSPIAFLRSQAVVYSCWGDARD